MGKHVDSGHESPSVEAEEAKFNETLKRMLATKPTPQSHTVGSKSTNDAKAIDKSD